MEKSNNYKIAFFSDLKKGSSSLLKTALGLADMLRGEVELFHVINSTDAVYTDNQFSALRSMKDEFAATERKIQRILGDEGKQPPQSKGYRLSMGNVKNEISNYLQECQPDIVVLGRRKSNPFDFIGDGVTQHVLEKHQGLVLIASEAHPLESGMELKLGVLNDSQPTHSHKVYESLLENVQRPIRSFSFVEGGKASAKSSALENQEVVQYVFEHNENTLGNLSNYLSKNNINLLWFERSKQDDNTVDLLSKNLRKVIDKVQLPILLGANPIKTKQPS